jgi:hypothetical protein
MPTAFAGTIRTGGGRLLRLSANPDPTVGGTTVAEGIVDQLDQLGKALLEASLSSCHKARHKVAALDDVDFGVGGRGGGSGGGIGGGSGDGGVSIGSTASEVGNHHLFAHVNTGRNVGDGGSGIGGSSLGGGGTSGTRNSTGDQVHTDVVNIHHHVHIRNPANVASVAQPPLRARRGKQASKNHSECTVYLDADVTFYERWRGDCDPTWSAATCLSTRISRVSVKMVDTLIQVDSLFADALERTISFRAAGAHVQTSHSGEQLPDLTEIAAATRVHDAYGQWLAAGATYDGDGSSLEPVRQGVATTALDSCLNYLFTHVALNGSALGIASTPGICADGHVCVVGPTSTLQPFRVTS